MQSIIEIGEAAARAILVSRQQSPNKSDVATLLARGVLITLPDAKVPEIIKQDVVKRALAEHGITEAMLRAAMTRERRLMAEEQAKKTAEPPASIRATKARSPRKQIDPPVTPPAGIPVTAASNVRSSLFDGSLTDMAVSDL